MDHTDLDHFASRLIDDLTPGDDAAGPRLSQLLESPTPAQEKSVVAVMAAAVTLRNLTDHLLAAVTATVERIGAPARYHQRNGTDMLTDLGVAPGAAYRFARVGRAAPELPSVTRDQRLGGLGIESADAIGTGIRHIESRTPLSEADRAQLVTKLMIEPTPAAINRKARAMAIAAARENTAERAVPVAEDAELNNMTLTHNTDGRIHVTLDVDVHTGEELHSALDPLCRPTPLPDGSRDPRTAGQRRAEALGQLVRSYLSGQDRPASGGVLPHVTLVRPAPSDPDATRTEPTPGEQFLAALAELPTDTLGFTGPISIATADTICCDAAVTTVHVDHNGAPLDVGRTQRWFPPHIRKALAARDQGCAHPGCGAPVSWTDAHHIVWWSHSGPTSVDNGVLLCRRHHRAIHHGGWQVYLGADRHPWFIPPRDPAHPDREPEHLRSHARRTLTSLPAAA